jgi:hypothetical protein
MATDNGVTCMPFIAGADLSTHQFKAVKLDASGNVILAAIGDPAIGILQNDPTLGQEASVAINGGPKAMAGAVFAPQVKLMVDANGKLVTAVAAASRNVVAMSLESSAADGNIVRVLWGAPPVLA